MSVAGQGLPALLARTKNPIGIEIGLSAGHTTRYLFDHIDGLVLHGVDPYPDYVDWNGDVLSPDHQLDVYARFQKHTALFRDRIIHHRLTSDEAAPLLPDDSFDFVFIDARHTYDQVLKDCENYYPKVKSGGLFSGHDYSVIADVGRAVREFASRVGAGIGTTETDVWYWWKP